VGSDKHNVIGMLGAPAGAETILIAGDNDASWTRQAAAFALARRLVREGDVVEVRVPFTKDRDWADEDA
jgi:putative DNA primase/helicase